MTSANVIEYTITDKDGKDVGYHRQNIMCSTCNDGLEKYQPASDFTIRAHGYDEEEEYWEEDYEFDEEEEQVLRSLEDFIIKNPAQFTFRNFEVGEKVKVSKRRGIGTVEGVHKGKWMPFYTVKLENETIVEVQQSEVLPT